MFCASEPSDAASRARHSRLEAAAADAQLRVPQGRLLWRTRQLLPQQQRALREALRRVRRERVRLARPGPAAGRGKGQAAVLRRRHPSLPEQDLEPAAARGGGSRRRRRGPPATEEPLGLRDAGVRSGSRPLPVAAVDPTRRLARREAGRHRERHRALQGVLPPRYVCRRRNADATDQAARLVPVHKFVCCPQADARAPLAFLAASVSEVDTSLVRSRSDPGP